MQVEGGKRFVMQVWRRRVIYGRHRQLTCSLLPFLPQMIRAITLFAFVAVATAFAPARVARSSSSLKMAFAQGLPGADGPELKNFDPLGFTQKSPEWTLFFREAELKHGRIAMLATLGWIVADFHNPVLGVSSFEAHAASVSQGGLIQVLIWVSILEHISIIANRELGKGREPGDFAFDPLGLVRSSPMNLKKVGDHCPHHTIHTTCSISGQGKKDINRMKVAELKNGRLAMMAISGIATQAGLGHAAFPYI